MNIWETEEAARIEIAKRRRGGVDMVKIVRKRGETFYSCEECGLAYEEKMWAEKCEDFCTKHHSCSLEITSHAVKIN